MLFSVECGCLEWCFVDVFAFPCDTLHFVYTVYRSIDSCLKNTQFETQKKMSS